MTGAYLRVQRDGKEEMELRNAAAFWGEVHSPLQRLSAVVGQNPGDDITLAPALAVTRILWQAEQLKKLEKALREIRDTVLQHL